VQGLARSLVGRTTSRSGSYGEKEGRPIELRPPAPGTMSNMIYQVVGYGGTAPSQSLGLLAVATAMASSPRLGSGAVAPQRGPLCFCHGLLAHAQTP